jgi:hypothetical protein
MSLYNNKQCYDNETSATLLFRLDHNSPDLVLIFKCLEVLRLRVNGEGVSMLPQFVAQSANSLRVFPIASSPNSRS